MTLIDALLGKYTVWFLCTNCNSTQQVGINKGTTINDFLESFEARCKFCGCPTLTMDLAETINNKKDSNSSDVRRYKHGTNK